MKKKQKEEEGTRDKNGGAAAAHEKNEESIGTDVGPGTTPSLGHSASEALNDDFGADNRDPNKCWTGRRMVLAELRTARRRGEDLVSAECYANLPLLRSSHRKREFYGRSLSSYSSGTSSCETSCVRTSP